MKTKVLLVEDDKAIARLLQDNLIFEGFCVQWCETSDNAITTVRDFSPNLVLLDLMLQNGADGLDICRALSAGSERIPVIILTARGQKEDKIKGLMSGADDYVTKPFAFDELLARIHAVLRRTAPRLDQLKLGDTIVDFRRLRASKGKEELILTDREFEILRHLTERVGEVVKRDELLRLVWGYADPPTTRTVDNFIFRLRSKIEPDPHHPRYIRTAYGDGYRLTLDE